MSSRGITSLSWRELSGSQGITGVFAWLLRQSDPVACILLSINSIPSS
jgi:hypothetical protein